MPAPYKAGDGPVPCVITLFGGLMKGRAPEDLAAAICGSGGFATLALGYFGPAYDNLPRSLFSGDSSLDMTYIEEAVDLVSSMNGIRCASLLRLFKSCVNVRLFR